MKKARILTNRVSMLAKHFPVIAITGARQIGKTTFLHELFGPDFKYVVFKQNEDHHMARTDPMLFLKNNPTPLILDEIQYAPELVASIKVLVDENRQPGQYFLTGSQQWSVIKSMSESLAGRVAILDMDSFCLAEIADAQNNKPWLENYLTDPDSFLKNTNLKRLLDKILFEQLFRGFLPDAQAIEIAGLLDFHRSYQDSYVTRDIRHMTEVSDWQLFRRFTQLLAGLSAQEINHSQLGRELGIKPQTAASWVRLLDATYQWFEIHPFSRNTTKRISKKPKGYLSDTGALCFLHGISSPEALAGHPLWGAIFETAVIGEIRKQIHLMGKNALLSHWRSHGGAEVDLIIEMDGRFYPIEIKGKSNPSRGDTTGITAFKQTYPNLNIAPGLILCACEEKHPLTSDIWALPWDAGLPITP